LWIIVVWIVFEAVLLLIVPGPSEGGPITPKGNCPQYKLNGVACFLITHVLLYISILRLQLFSVESLFSEIGSIVATSLIGTFFVCWLLYWKGRYFPTNNDFEITGNVIYDFYSGVELHPEIFGISLKQLINCRVAMMGWSVLISIYLLQQLESYHQISNSMLLSVFLQQLYILKFFIWEKGYFASIDIHHDHFGFYICWGVMVFLPSLYPSVPYYLVHHPIDISPGWFSFILIFGLLSLLANYDSDRQRQKVRETNGKALIWGKKPKLLKVTYSTTEGKQHETVLLCSGWWGVARHIHYVFELSLTLAWTLPAQFEHFFPYIYFFYLTALLIHRIGRDEVRCSKKYGHFWAEYCSMVPYRMIPLIF